MYGFLLTLGLFADGQGANPAGGAPAAPGGGGGLFGGGMEMWLFMAVGFGLLYFMVIRPAQRKDRDRKDALNKLKKGDKVVMAGGIVGTVYSTEESVPGL